MHSDMIHLQVGAQQFEISRQVLLKHSNTLLCTMVTEADEPLVLNRDPNAFQLILNYLNDTINREHYCTYLGLDWQMCRHQTSLETTDEATMLHFAQLFDSSSIQNRVLKAELAYFNIPHSSFLKSIADASKLDYVKDLDELVNAFEHLIAFSVLCKQPHVYVSFTENEGNIKIGSTFFSRVATLNSYMHAIKLLFRDEKYRDEFVERLKVRVEPAKVQLNYWFEFKRKMRGYFLTVAISNFY